MKRLVIAICLLLAGCAGIGTTSHGAALAAPGGNADAAHACQHGRYLTLLGTNGSTVTTFSNTGECVSYAAHGGTLVSKTAAARCLNGGYAKLTSVSGGKAFASEAACVLFVGQGGTPVSIPSVSVTFTSAGSPYCNVIVTLANFAPNTTYPSTYSINGGAAHTGPNLTTDANGTLTTGVFSYDTYTRRTIVFTVGGVSSSPATVAC